MPLDGSELFANPALAKLWEVECLLATEDQWCKGRLHDRKGRHCLVGAITEANARQELTRPIIGAIKEVSDKHYWRIESFNDDPSTSHQDVLRVLNRARLLIIADIARTNEPKSWFTKMRDITNEMLSLAIGQQQNAHSGNDYTEIEPALVPPRINQAICPDEFCEQVRETADLCR
jgi:hypothetical protein